MTLLLNDADVRQLVDYDELIEVLSAFVGAESLGTIVQPPRQNLERDGVWLRMMPVIVPSMGVMGFKAFHGVPRLGARYLVSLCDMETGGVLALVDAAYLTAARTAATTAVATRALAPPGWSRLGVIGSGLEAETHCLALATVTELSEVRVFSPNPQRRSAFGERMQARLGVPVIACDDPESAVAGAEHVVIATNTGPQRHIACRAEWLEAGQHVAAIGSTNLQLREVDTDVFRRADVTVFDVSAEQIGEESGDAAAFLAEGGRLDDVHLLHEVVAGRVPGRRSAADLTLFKSVGAGYQDLAAALSVYRQARECGAGTDLDMFEAKVFAADAGADDAIVTGTGRT